jgi:hypothetical protein
MKAAALMALAAGLALGQSKPAGAAKKTETSKSGQAKPPAQAARAQPEAKPYVPKPVMPPAGSVEIAPNEWRYIEKGSVGEPDKVWIYRRTPFGLAKSEEETPAAEDRSNGIEAVDKGDSVEFSSNSPFGVKRWTKKKPEMDEMEKAAYNRATKKTPASK